MKSQHTTTVNVRVKKGKKTEFLNVVKQLDYATVSPQTQEFTNIEKGKYKPGEKPSDFAGSWEDSPADLSEIRKSWQRNYE
jgi:hypothetical protein